MLVVVSSSSAAWGPTSNTASGDDRSLASATSAGPRFVDRREGASSPERRDAAWVSACGRTVEATLSISSPLDTLVARIVDAWSPAQIWLFGSRARGDAQDYSDWDLLVVLPDSYPGDLDPIETWRIGREARVEPTSFRTR